MKIAIILNTNQLGGAERSLIEQLEVMKASHDLHFYLPRLPQENTSLVNFIKSKGLTNIATYEYPSFLYKVSRRDLKKLPLILLKLPLLLKYVLGWNKVFSEFTAFYINGNKASFPIFLWSILFRTRISIYWHFRDFPSPKAFKFLGNFLPKVAPFQKMVLVANSEAVARELKVYFSSYQIKTIYNLAGHLPARSPRNKIRHIGIVSMFAPWKGIHDVIMAVGLYETELRQLGVEKISFYGENIYQTEGEHKNYSEQVKILSKKMGAGLVCFPGLRPPEIIFSEIDLLIHPSISPEPFGRVIIEAFKTHTPVISTALGGAKELINHMGTGLAYRPHDPAMLFEAVKLLVENNQLVEDLTQRAFQKAQLIEKAIEQQISELIS